MEINICPYYYRDGVSNDKIIHFEYCHKPIYNKCPDGREANECKVCTFTGEITEEGREWIMGKFK